MITKYFIDIFSVIFVTQKRKFFVSEALKPFVDLIECKIYKKIQKREIISFCELISNAKVAIRGSNMNNRKD